MSENEPKKISFGFSKLTKKSAVVFQPPKQEEKKVELIECLEGQNILIKDAVVEEIKPLVIPIQENNKNLLERVKEVNELKERTKKLLKAKADAKAQLEDRPDSELTLDELAAKKLMEDAKKIESIGLKTTKVDEIPKVEDNLILEGSKEPTLEDYENVPISDYGLAMLRGMGWSEKTGIGKTNKSVAVALPELRPKGLGLGANKMLAKELEQKAAAVDDRGNKLILIKGAHAKVIAGNQKGNYCIVQGLDDEAGRVIVKMYLTGNVMTMHEFMLVPVTAKEFKECSKVLNNAKYEEYKNNESRVKTEDVIVIKDEEDDKADYKRTIRRSRSRSRSKNGHRRSKSRDKHQKRSRSRDNRKRSTSRNRSSRRRSRSKDRRYRSDSEDKYERDRRKKYDSDSDQSSSDSGKYKSRKSSKKAKKQKKKKKSKR